MDSGFVVGNLIRSQSVGATIVLHKRVSVVATCFAWSS
jgi:hypothetical protein